MRPLPTDSYILDEALDDYAFGADVQATAVRHIALNALLRWFLANYWELQWACGDRAVRTLDLELLWGCVHSPERVTPLGASKWWQSRAKSLQEPLGWYCSYD